VIEQIGWTLKSAKTTMQKKLWKMILIVTIPLMLIIILVVGIGLGYGLQYNSILNNVTTASDFNR
jgi:heme/copper-type cytochrome/quinol oxidase subunit 2